MQFSYDPAQHRGRLESTLLSGCPTYVHVKSHHELPVSPVSGKVEQIVVCGLLPLRNAPVKKIRKTSKEEKEEDLVFSQETTTGMVRIRAPNVSIVEDWRICFYA